MNHISPDKYKTIGLISMCFIVSKHTYFLLKVTFQKCLKHQCCKIELFVDGWTMKSVRDVETGEDSRQDIFEGTMEISHLGSDKYLGQTISADGRNTSNIEKIKNKGIDIQNKIIQMLHYSTDFLWLN